MWCPRCGSETEDGTAFCSVCGQDLKTYQQLWQNGAPSATTPRSFTSPPTAPAQYQGPVSPPVGYPFQRPQIPSHLGLAIVGLLLFWPTGIPALVYATRVDSRLLWGDVAGAWDASHKAKVWGWVSVSLTLAWILFVLLFVVIGVGVAALGY